MVAVVAALCMTALVGMTAMVVDIGLALSNRSQLQGATDMAALSATYKLSAGSTNQVNTSAATLSVGNALTGNGFPASSITSTTSVGNYDSTRASGARFSSTTLPINAVHVSTAGTSPVLFGAIFTNASTLALGASSTATMINLAGLTAGTTVLTVDTNQSIILNGLLGSLLGTSVNLTAASYQGLLAANVSAASLLPALATQAKLTTGTYGQLATVSLTAGQIAQAALSAAVTSGAANAAALAALGSLTASTSAAIPLSGLIGLTAYTNQIIGSTLSSTALAGSINLYSLITAAAQLSAGAGTISLTPNISLPVTGSSVSIQMSIGQPAQSTPFLTFSPVGSSVRTAQIRLYITVTLVNVSLLGIGLMTLHVPVYIEAASGTATLSAISCGANPPTDATVTVAGQTGLATAWIGNVTPAALADFSKPVTPTIAQIGNVTLLTLDALSGPDTILKGSGNLTFTQAQIHAVPPASQTITSTTGPLNASLFTNLQILGIGLLPTQANLLSVLNPALLNVVNPVIGDLLGALGFKLGSMDVTVTGVRCGIPTLVE